MKISRRVGGDTEYYISATRFCFYRIIMALLAQKLSTHVNYMFCSIKAPVCLQDL